ncbi:protein ASPARTIC PROTEASE IN GUARD CELL 1-like [Andrographis paniculata]|uniref:protein ASPARTIC PROTEASE IN GUARD CELL 1-like n=1 Tax=Andrographis paniculata TaxID=175694 RepID=UPI0021E705A7|nr:protein ASPARTIC PROTEASE IN GUARD CELL 1-like [Andrographis paniculata]
MEKIGSLFLDILCTIFAVLVSSGLSRTLPLNSETSVLDISAALSKTQELFLLNSKNVLPSKHQEHHRRSVGSPVSALSFQVHSRMFVQGSPEKDYQALTLTRLARDSARVKAIQSRLDLASSDTNMMPLEEEEEEEEKIKGPVISGTGLGSGEYFCRIGIGNPPTQAYMVLDTGSDINWVQCEPCADCYQQSDPIFNPGVSSSFNPLTCEAEQCRSLELSECRNDTCLYQVSYGDGSYTVGDFVTETITFSDSAAVPNVAMGCGHNNEGLFIAASGLIGLGGGKLSLPSQINASSFSYCLVDRDSDSSSTLEFNSAPPASTVFASLIRNSKLDTFYYLDITGISVAGELLSIPASTFRLDENGDGGMIVDSGTAITRLGTEAYNAMRDAFKKGTGNLKLIEGVALFDTCYDLSTLKSVEVPTVSFQFSNGKELQLPAKNYMIPVDSTGTFCFAFAPTSSSPGILGNVQQQGTRVSYDLANSQIGFKSNSC